MLHASRVESTPVSSIGVSQRGLYTANDSRTFYVATLPSRATHVSGSSAYGSAASTMAILLTVIHPLLERIHAGSTCTVKVTLPV